MEVFNNNFFGIYIIVCGLMGQPFQNRPGYIPDYSQDGEFYPRPFFLQSN